MIASVVRIASVVGVGGHVSGRSWTRHRAERLARESLPVSVYAGIDPVSKKRHYLVETVYPEPSAARDVERVRGAAAERDR